MNGHRPATHLKELGTEAERGKSWPERENSPAKKGNRAFAERAEEHLEID